MHPLHHVAELFRHAGDFLQRQAESAASLPDAAGLFNIANQILKETRSMSVDLSRLSADIPKVVAALAAAQQLPALQAQIADLQAKLAAAPHEDPTVQTTVDGIASALETALNPPAAPATATDANTSATVQSAAPTTPPAPAVDPSAQPAAATAPAAPAVDPASGAPQSVSASQAPSA